MTTRWRTTRGGRGSTPSPTSASTLTAAGPGSFYHVFPAPHSNGLLVAYLPQEQLFPALKALRHRRGGYLSGGEQQMLTIGRSLMANPDLLLLDEPSEGLAPLIVEALHTRIDLLRTEGLAILLAEQSLDFVLSLSDRVHVLEKGEVRFSGAPGEVRASEEMLQRYLTV